MTDDKQVLDLEEPLDLNTMFLDTACVKANIHFPVDWVLLRDGVKSLMQSVELIRTHGLKSLAFARDPMFHFALAQCLDRGNRRIQSSGVCQIARKKLCQIIPKVTKNVPICRISGVKVCTVIGVYPISLRKETALSGVHPATISSFTA